MEAQGILQILVFLAVLTALTPLIGGYMAKVFTGRRVWLTPVLGPVERGTHPGLRQRSEPRAGLEAVREVGHRLLGRLLAAALPDHSDPVDDALQPPGPHRSPLGPHLQHHHLLPHQHQLAVLRRRDHDELLHADGGTGRPELPLGRGRHRGADRFHTRPHRTLRHLARQLLAGPAAVADLRARTDLGRSGAVLHVAGCDPEPRRLQHLRHGHRRLSDPGHGPGGIPGGDQAPRHQRRRLLQRQLVDAVREPDRSHELRADPPDPDHPGGPDRDLRPHGRKPPPGLGHLCGDDDPLHRRGRWSSTRPRATAPSPSTSPASTAATWRARRRASESPTPPCSQR